jgi:hypothetical protein
LRARSIAAKLLVRMDSWRPHPDGAEQIPMVRAIHRISVDTEIITVSVKIFEPFHEYIWFQIDFKCFDKF